MTYEQALAFWFGRVNYEQRSPKPSDLTLDRMHALLDRLGNPQCKGQDVDAKAVDAWAEIQLVVIAEHTALIARAIELATREGELFTQHDQLSANVSDQDQ